MNILANIVGTVRKAVGTIMNFLSPPTAPTFTDSVTRQDADLTTIAHYLLPSDITVSGNLKRQVLLTGSFVSLNLRGVKGDRGNPIVIKGDGSTIIGSSSLNQHALDLMSNPDNSNHVELWDVEIRTSSNASYSGIIFNADTNGAVFRAFNIKANSIGYACFLAQDQVTSRKYKSIFLGYWQVDGYVTDGEPFYIGYVTLTSASEFDNVSIVHCRVINKGRDGAQFKKCNWFYFGNNTLKNVARISVPAAQDHAFQIEASIGVIENNIFDTVHRPWNVFTHQATVENNLILFDGQAAYIGDALSQSGFAGDPRLVGGTQTYKNNIIVWVPAGLLPFGCEIEEATANIVFDSNAWVGNIGAMLFYHPTSPTGTLTGNAFGNNGNTLSATLADALVYLSTTISSSDFLKLANASASLYTRKLGALVPLNIKKVLQSVEVIDLQVPLNTSWATALASLPSQVRFYTTDGTSQLLTVTWAQGSYNQSTPGTYQVYGTPTVSGSLTNPYNIKAEQYLTVNTPPSVKIVLAGTSPSYTATGNYNHIPQSFSTGVQPIRGDNSGQVLASLRDTDGNLTGFGISITSQFQGEALGQNSNGVYPATANVNNWTNPGASGTSRVFTITGLAANTVYGIKILCSVDTGIAGSSHLVTLNVAGSSGGGTVSNIEARGNVNTTQNFTVTSTAGGVITITVTKTATGAAVINIVEITF